MGYFTTEGRINRWKYFLQILPPALFGGVGAQVMGSGDPEAFAIGFFMAILANIVALFPAVRRLHDINASGWWFILSLVPLANFALGVTLLFVKGTQGENRFGPDPLHSEGSQGEDESAKRTRESRTSSSEVRGRAQPSSTQEFDPDEHEKKCPMCAEYIKLEARRCKHCEHEMSEEEVERQIEERKQEVENQRERRKEREVKDPKDLETPPPDEVAARCGDCHYPLRGDEKRCPRCQRELVWS